MKIQTMHPWQTGPTELIAFALEQMHKGSDFDRRLAFLILDVGVETLLKTYLTLPDTVTGARSPFGERRKASRGTFHDLTQGIKAAVHEPEVIFDLDHVMFIMRSGTPFIIKARRLARSDWTSWKGMQA